jgi:UDP:flavonoid glycosyltransferase YjiC (YdhE family)
MLPFVGLGEALRARGHDVTLFGSRAFAEMARRAGLAFIDLYDAEAQQDLLGSEANPPRQRGFLRTLNKHALRQMERVYRLLAERHVPGETVAAAPGWLFGARLAQEKLGLPLATVALQPLMLGSIYDVPGLPAWVPRWLPRLFRGLISRSVDRALVPALNDFRAELALPPVGRPVLKWWQSPQRTIGFFPAWYSAPQPDWPSPTTLAGFPLYSPAEAADACPELDEYLADGDPPLVFSQASLVKSAQDYFQTSITVAQNLGRRAVLLTPHRQQVPPQLPPGVRHFDFAPLSRLLPR